MHGANAIQIEVVWLHGLASISVFKILMFLTYSNYSDVLQENWWSRRKQIISS
jgi:hypothetical protein